MLWEQILLIPASVPGKKLLFSFLEKNYSHSRKQKFKLIHRSAVGCESGIICFLSAAPQNDQLFSVCRWKRVSFLDDFFNGFLFQRNFQMEEEKNSGREHTDKILDRNIFKKWSWPSQIFKTAIFCPGNGGSSARWFIPLTVRFQVFVFLFHF